MSFPELALDRQLCFLFHRVDQAIQARYRPILNKIGLTYPQYLAMLVLWETGEGALTVGALCERLASDTGTVSPLLKRLEKAGLIARRRDPADDRSVLVSLSPPGRALESVARSVPHQILSCLGPDSPGEHPAPVDWHGQMEALLARLDHQGA